MYQRGFTLIELLITVAIIAILLAIALPAYKDFVQEQRFVRSVTMGTERAKQAMLNTIAQPETAHRYMVATCLRKDIEHNDQFLCNGATQDAEYSTVEYQALCTLEAFAKDDHCTLIQ